MSLFKNLFKYRQMIAGLVHREIRGRYKGSVLGFLWTFLNPLLQLGVYTLLFSVILNSEVEKYYIFLFVALVPWMFFSSCLAAGCNSIVASGAMVTKIYFPREVLPISFVVSAFVNMLYSFIVVFAVLVFSGFGVNPVALLYLPVVFAVEFLLCLGVTLLFSALTVYIRDLEHILGILALLFQFLTPVMYSSSRIPEEYKVIFNMNPMASVIECYRSILYYKTVPELSTLGLAVCSGLVVLVLGEFIFSKLQKGFAEEL
ncbi:MAG: ABC transporter permease [Treponema sp.]|nr:ABC transporter permease [Treponema sp.]